MNRTPNTEKTTITVSSARRLLPKTLQNISDEDLIKLIDELDQFAKIFLKYLKNDRGH